MRGIENRLAVLPPQVASVQPEENMISIPWMSILCQNSECHFDSMFSLDIVYYVSDHYYEFPKYLFKHCLKLHVVLAFTPG